LETAFAIGPIPTRYSQSMAQSDDSGHGRMAKGFSETVKKWLGPPFDNSNRSLKSLGLSTTNFILLHTYFMFTEDESC
jgi:hypothetical protein